MGTSFLIVTFSVTSDDDAVTVVPVTETGGGVGDGFGIVLISTFGWTVFGTRKILSFLVTRWRHQVVAIF